MPSVVSDVTYFVSSVSAVTHGPSRYVLRKMKPKAKSRHREALTGRSPCQHMDLELAVEGRPLDVSPVLDVSPGVPSDGERRLPPTLPANMAALEQPRVTGCAGVKLKENEMADLGC